MLRQTGENIISELSIVSICKTDNVWEVLYRIKRSYIEPQQEIDIVNKKTIIRNSMAVYDDNDNIVEPEGTQVTDFENTITSYSVLESQVLDLAISHSESIGIFNEYVDDTDIIWEEEQLPTGIIIESWVPGEKVAPGFLRKSSDVNYRCILKHTTQLGWEPPITPSLWAVAPTQGGTGYPLWVQPSGAHDAYQMNDIVEHNGDNWKSLVNGNVWEPTTVNSTLWVKIT